MSRAFVKERFQIRWGDNVQPGYHGRVHTRSTYIPEYESVWIERGDEIEVEYEVVNNRPVIMIYRFHNRVPYNFPIRITIPRRFVE